MSSCHRERSGSGHDMKRFIHSLHSVSRALPHLVSDTHTRLLSLNLLCDPEHPPTAVITRQVQDPGFFETVSQQSSSASRPQPVVHILIVLQESYKKEHEAVDELLSPLAQEVSVLSEELQHGMDSALAGKKAELKPAILRPLQDLVQVGAL